MNDNYVRIRIQGESDTKAFQAAEKDLQRCSAAAREFVDTLKMGVGIDLGGRIVHAIAEIPRIFKEAIQEGIHFNAEMETARLTIAGMVKQFSGGQIKDFQGGLAVSDQLIQQMRKSADELGISFESAIETYKTTAGALFNAGVTDLQKQVDLTILLSRTMQGLGISGFQATRDIQDILTGMADRTKAARELGLHDVDIKAAEHAGKLAEFLESKLAGFAEAGAQGTHTYNAELQRLQNTLQQVEGEVSKPIFEALKESYAVLTEELKNPDVKAALEELGVDLAMVVKTGAELLSWALQNAEALSTLVKWTTLVGVSFATLKLAEIATGLGLTVAGWEATTTAMEAETAAIARNTAAMAQNAGAAATASAAHAGVAVAGAAGSGVASSDRRWTNFGDAEPFARRGFNTTDWRSQMAERDAGRAGIFRKTYDDFGYVDNRHGLMLTPDGPRGRFGSQIGATLGRDARSFGGVGGALASTADALAIPALIASIANLITALNQLKDVTKSGEKTGRDEDSAAQDKIFKRLFDRAQDVTGDTLEDTRGQLSRAQENAQQMIDSGDPLKVSAGKERLKQFQDLSEGLDDRAARNDADAARGQALSDAATARDRAHDDAQRAEQKEALWTADAPKALEAQNRAQLSEANSPQEKMMILDSQIDDARKNFNTQATGAGAGAVSDKAGSDELFAATNRAYLPEDAEKLREAAGGILSLEKQRRDVEKEIHDDEQAARKDDFEKDKARKEALSDMKDEHDILSAQIAGENSKARELEYQRQLRQQLAALEKEGISTPETQAAAAANIQLKRDADTKGLNQKRATDDASNEVAEAQLGHSKRRLRDAQVNQVRVQKQQEYESQGMDSDEAQQRANDAGDLEDRKIRKEQGIIGGSAKRSSRDHLGDGLTDADDWSKKFSPGGSLTGTMLDSDEKKGGFGGGLSSDSDWKKRFPGAVSAQVPAVASNAPADAVGGDGTSTASAGNPATDLTTAASSVKKAGTDVSGAANKLKTSADGMGSTTSTALDNVNASIKTLGSTITQKFSDFQSQIDAINTQLNNA